MPPIITLTCVDSVIRLYRVKDCESKDRGLKKTELVSSGGSPGEISADF